MASVKVMLHSYGFVKLTVLSIAHNPGTLFPQVSSHLSVIPHITSTDNNNVCVFFLFFKDGSR